MPAIFLSKGFSGVPKCSIGLSMRFPCGTICVDSKKYVKSSVNGYHAPLGDKFVGPPLLQSFRWLFISLSCLFGQLYWLSMYLKRIGIR